MSAGSASGSQHPLPIVGAIRWDAWTDGPVTRQVERTLAPPQFRWRLPWFARVEGDRAMIQGDTQAVMDQEIRYAADAGLNYWAFVQYNRDDAMSRSLELYRASALRDRIGFCLILHTLFRVADERWSSELEHTLDLLAERGYQTVLGGRPLVYAFEMTRAGRFPEERFAQFRARASARGLDPYLVYMGWNPREDWAAASAWGFDAVSAYACGSDDATFEQLVRRAESRYWHAAAEANVPYVPLVTTGWDKRPRQVNPVTWEVGQAYLQQRVFPEAATPAEIAQHLGRALQFVADHRGLCVAHAVIVYAWNENDEGGWLVPTWTPTGTPDTSRIDHVKQLLDRAREQQPNDPAIRQSDATLAWRARS